MQANKRKMAFKYIHHLFIHYLINSKKTKNSHYLQCFISNTPYQNNLINNTDITLNHSYLWLFLCKANHVLRIHLQWIISQLCFCNCLNNKSKEMSIRERTNLVNQKFMRQWLIPTLFIITYKETNQVNVKIKFFIIKFRKWFSQYNK